MTIHSHPRADGQEITVLTAHGEKVFAANSFAVDDNGYLSVRNDNEEIARFAPAEWAGVHRPPVGDRPQVITEGGDVPA